MLVSLAGIEGSQLSPVYAITYVITVYAITYVITVYAITYYC